MKKGEIEDKIKKDIFKGKQGFIFKIVLFPFLIVYKIGRFFVRIAGGTIKETEKVSEEKKVEKKYSEMKVLYFTDYGYRELKGKIEADLRSVTPETIEAMFGFDKVYTNLATGEPLVVLYEHHPKTINFEDKMEVLEGKKPVLYLKPDKKSQKFKYSINMEKYKIKGGKILSEVAYKFVNTTYLQLLRPISDTKLRNTFLMALFIGLFMGALILSVIYGILF